MTTITITQDALDSIMTRLSALETENTKLKARVDYEFDHDEDQEMDFWNNTNECDWNSLRFAAKLVVGYDSADMGMFGDVKELWNLYHKMDKKVAQLMKDVKAKQHAPPTRRVCQQGLRSLVAKNSLLGEMNRLRISRGSQSSQSSE